MKVAAFAILLLLPGARLFAQQAPPEALPVIGIGHAGHDHQIALGVAAIEGATLEAKAGAWLNELKAGEVYVLMEGQKPLAELHLTKIQGGSAIPASMERGEIEIGLGGIPAIAFFADQGNDFKIVSGLNTDGDMLVMRPDFEASSWKEFVEKVKASEKPLTIGYKAPVAVAKLVFERGLAAEGIAFGPSGSSGPEVKVQLLDLHGEQNLMPSLASALVDGYVVNEPSASLAEVKGAGRIVCDLSDLPPEGMWRDHPCCCVAVRMELLKKHPEAVRALLKTILVGTRILQEDRAKAAEIAAQWTRQPLEVEQRSVPHIRYGAIPDEGWEKGMLTWIRIMQETGAFEKRFKDMAPEKVLEALCDFSFLEAAEKGSGKK